MNAVIRKLEKAQKRAKEIANMRDANESRWLEIYDNARKSPEWKTYCAANGICESYNYTDIIC